MEPKKHLPINLSTFGFVEREEIKGKKLIFQCWRDFAYYALHYYYPEKFNRENLNPLEIRSKGIFGIKNLPVWLIWTGLSFYKVPQLFSNLKLSLSVNGMRVKSYFSFIFSLLPFKIISPEKIIEITQKAVDDGKVAGLDVNVRLFGLVDHVMFVYGYDEENFYVLDTNNVIGLEYEKITPEGDNRFIMKFPKSLLKRKLTIFNRVWVVSKI